MGCLQDAYKDSVSDYILAGMRDHDPADPLPNGVNENIEVPNGHAED